MTQVCFDLRFHALASTLTMLQVEAARGGRAAEGLRLRAAEVGSRARLVYFACTSAKGRQLSESAGIPVWWLWRFLPPAVLFGGAVLRRQVRMFCRVKCHDSDAAARAPSDICACARLLCVFCSTGHVGAASNDRHELKHAVECTTPRLCERGTKHTLGLKEHACGCMCGTACSARAVAIWPTQCDSIMTQKAHYSAAKHDNCTVSQLTMSSGTSGNVIASGRCGLPTHDNARNCRLRAGCATARQLPFAAGRAGALPATCALCRAARSA